jgi:hypothetical protein
MREIVTTSRIHDSNSERDTRERYVSGSNNCPPFVFCRVEGLCLVQMVFIFGVSLAGGILSEIDMPHPYPRAHYNYDSGH